MKRYEIGRLLEADRGGCQLLRAFAVASSRTVPQTDAGTVAGRTHPPAVDAERPGAAPSSDDCVPHAPIGEGATALIGDWLPMFDSPTLRCESYRRR